MAVPGVTELEGTRLRMFRRRRGMTEKELADIIGVDPQLIIGWETMEAWCHDRVIIDRLAQALNYPPSSFSGSEIDPLGDDTCSFRPFVDGSSDTYDVEGMAKFGVECACCDKYETIEIEDTPDCQDVADKMFGDMGWVEFEEDYFLCPSCYKMGEPDK